MTAQHKDPPDNNASSRPRRSRKKPSRFRSPRFWLFIAILLYVLTLAGITYANAIGPEKWWASGLNLYLPQWAWGIPGLALLIASLRIAWRWTWAPLLCLLWVAGPLMGFCWGTELPADAVAGKPTLRVMTYNIKYGQRDLSAVMNEITAQQPDLLLIQDANGVMKGEMGKILPLYRFLMDRNVRLFGQYVIASKLPITDVQVRWISFPGERHSCLRGQLRVGGKLITVYDVHFLTPREGLSAMKAEAEGGIPTLIDNMASRLHQARTLAAMVREEPGPLIVAGDLNAPETSLVCQTLQQVGLHDAFSEAGRGYGYTYGHMLRLRHSYMRIDHILLSKHWRAQRCWTGAADGSDHRPVIADLVLP